MIFWEWNRVLGSHEFGTMHGLLEMRVVTSNKILGFNNTLLVFSNCCRGLTPVVEMLLRSKPKHPLLGYYKKIMVDL